jgi:hypothetical protein
VLLAARVPRYLFLAWLGSRLGRDTLPYLRHHIWELVALASALFIALYLVVRLVHDRRVTQSQATVPK